MGICWFSWPQSRVLFRKTKSRRAVWLPWLGPSANRCFIKCWFPLWSWGNGGGGGGKWGSNKEPFRCGIQNRKVTEGFCSKPCWAMFTVSQRRTVYIHAVKLCRDPAARERRSLLASAPSSPRRCTALCILSSSMVKTWVLPRICID